MRLTAAEAKAFLPAERTTRRRNPPRSTSMSETQIVKTILDGLASHRIWAKRLNSGAFPLTQNGKRRYFKATFSGCPDIICVLPGRGIGFIEVKKPGGVMSEDQRAFQALCVKHGVPHLVAMKWEEVEGWLK